MIGKKQNPEGVALIIILGVLTVLILLAAAFSHVMRTGRRAARGYADRVRAQQLVHAALGRAMEHVNAAMRSANLPYPVWTNGALVSSGSGPACDILSGGASNCIPGSLGNGAFAASTNCLWTDLVSSDGVTNGRIAYMVVNCSGLLDANYAGGFPRTNSTSVRELDLSGSVLPDVTNDAGFISDRDVHLRYETVSELGRLNRGVTDPVSNLFVYSYDCGRDEYFESPDGMGERGFQTFPKFYINELDAYTSCPSKSVSAYRDDTNFTAVYWNGLTGALASAGITNHRDSLAWNIVNYLDPDRVPQTDGDRPWLDDEGLEAVPLINEIILTTNSAPTEYKFLVELWYPFAPVTVTTNDGFVLQMAVFDSPTDVSAEPDLLSYTNALWAAQEETGHMEYGSTNEFRVFEFPFTNDVPITQPQVWFSARVCITNPAGVIPVDGAMGEEAVMFTNTAGWSVNDPRFNGDMSYWRKCSPTPGTANVICDPFSGKGQGLPLWHADGVMVNIGELGHIQYGSNQWRSVDIMSADEGAPLMDRLTVRPVNGPAKGLVSIGTGQTNVMRALFHNMEIGYGTNEFTLESAEIDGLAEALILGGPYRSWAHMFAISPLGPSYSNVAEAFRTAVEDSAPAGIGVTDLMYESPLRNIAELVSFRQNMFTVILAARVTAPRGTAVAAECRAVALVCRDGYTGRYFTRWLRWL
ncbi:MAG: hypothetical protein R6V03_05245 [Kiritimatiellia bacterium]